MIAALFLAAQMEMHDHAHEHERLGTIAFASSCNAAAQPMISRGVALLHSFWYEEAEKTFRAAADADPQCGIAWWGAAMSNYHQVWPTPYSPAELKRGIEAARKAKAVGAKTERERMYIDAVAAFFNGENRPAYESAMESLVAKYPGDDEARIFYALALTAHGMAQPTDKTYAYQKKAAGILNALLKKHPDHPGIAHYLIHSFDYPALAPLALDAAYAYSKIAPSSPHALHMPSHIFVRLGMWQETIDSNIASAKAARDYAAHNHPGAMPFDALHAYDYLTYAYLQRGEDGKAKALVDELATIKSLDVENFAGYYALAAVPARYAMERHRWTEAAALTVKPETFPWDRYPYAEAVTAFARAVGAARSGNEPQAREDVVRLQQLRAKLLEQKNAYWADQVEVQLRLANGAIAQSVGRDGQAVELMRSAADLEDSMDKSPVTPGSIIPAREMLADLLFDLGRSQQALEAYQAVLKDSPKRRNALAGAKAAAARVAGVQ